VLQTSASLLPFLTLPTCACALSVAIAQWVGTIPAGSEVRALVVSTDWLPTFLEAARLPLPAHMLDRIDGYSALPDLLALAPAPTSTPKKQPDGGKANRHRAKAKSERVVLWHNDFEGPRRTAAWLFDFKLLLDEHELPFQLFDMRTDPIEQHNLLPARSAGQWRSFLAQCPQQPGSNPAAAVSITRHMLRHQRADSALHLSIVCRMQASMLEYVTRGDEAYRQYRAQHPQLRYKATPYSDQRPVLQSIRVSLQEQARLKKELLFHTGCGSAPCSCAIKTVSQVPALPFPVLEVGERSRRTAAPWPFINASLLLGIAVPS
jgi:hypothetical protein